MAASSVPRTIVLCGVKRSGKDTCAEFISGRFGHRHVKFASLLKDACGTLFGLSEQQVEGPAKDETDTRWGVTPRRIMQFFGTELMQFELQRLLPSIGRCFWARQLLEKHTGERIVISDMRFQHEAQAVLLADPAALVIRVQRSAAPHDDAHISELEVNDITCHAMLQNDGSIEELHAKLLDVLTCPRRT